MGNIPSVNMFYASLELTIVFIASTQHWFPKKRDHYKNGIFLIPQISSVVGNLAVVLKKYY